MISPDAELNRLRWRLQSAGWQINEVDQIMDRATRDVNETILDIVSNAIAEATDYAQDIGAEEFIEEIDIKEVSGFFYVSTISGRANYSTPERQMLPDLLKNAEADPETGIKTKVIPVGAGNTTIKGDIFSTLQERQRRVQEARQSLIDSNADRRSDRATAMGSQFRAIVGRSLAAKRADKQVKSGNSQNLSFKTASSTQDPATQWVYPAKELDLTGYLMDLNRQMQDSMESAVLKLIDTYIQEYG